VEVSKVVRTLIVPLDGSLKSVQTLPFARAAARTLGGRVVLLRAVQHAGPHASPARPAPVLSELEGLARELRKEGIAAEAQVRWADPASAIVDAAREYDASIIVMADHQGHRFRDWLRGEVTEQVLHQTPVPVLVVPADGAPVPADDSTRRIVVPLDGSALAESAVVQLRRITEPKPLEVHLVSVIPRLIGPFGVVLPYVPDPETDRRQSERYLDEIAATLRAEGVVAHPWVIFQAGDSVAREILDLAQRTGADVIAMATHGRSHLAHLALGSVSTEILEHSPVPVLLTPCLAGSEPVGQPGERLSPGVAGESEPAGAS
jgi:nucleotide-binding universal stress UspA family protein